MLQLTKPIPKVKDLIGQAVKGITSYSELDNTDQVIALIDEVSVWLISKTTCHSLVNIKTRHLTLLLEKNC